MPAPSDFATFFSSAFQDGRTPYDYQKRLACGEKGTKSDTEWLTSFGPCDSRLISIPTGLGKTAAVILAWLWNRVANKNPAWPRRLVYCLPMRTLVEQTREEAKKWIEALGRATLIKSKPRVVVLMGGEQPDGDEKDWDLYPEDNTILIGTQDMLLSRALNRGYGMSRYRWPMHFGLLNNDCLWILDETQLMGSALWTSAQLDWMRVDRFASFKPCVSWWMSATLGVGFFDTLDRREAKISSPTPLTLSPEEEKSLPVLKACRPVRSLAYKVPATKKGKPTAVDPSTLFATELAKQILDEHPAGHLTLVVCNRVKHAQDIRAAIRAQAPTSETEVLLLTSRFRRQDRRETLRKVLGFEDARKRGEAHPGLILVSTQVIEAGFDVSAARLWTEAAPWPSFLQRLGRLNRDAKLNDNSPQAIIFPTKKGDTGPYDPNDLKTGAALTAKLASLCANHPEKPIRALLAQLAADPSTAKIIREALEPKPEPFPRAVDVHGLFSTEPDVFGGFTDISPWVRNSDSNADTSVFWRSFKPNNRIIGGDGPGLGADELCSVPVNRLRDLLGTSRKVWIWEPKKKQWEALRPADIRPGMTLMLPLTHGGYEPTLGWTGETSSRLTEAPPPGPFEDGDDEDLETQIGEWVTLDTHLADTRKVAEIIARTLALTPELETCLAQAAALHDIGKSLEKWQSALLTPRPKAAQLYAKSPWEYVLDLSESPNAADTCCDLILQNSKQQMIHKDSVTTPNCLRLQLRIRLRHELIGSLETLLKQHPKLSPFRPGCRHEAASALAMWRRYFYGEGSREFPALAIYIVAAHHGKVRTVLNSNPKVAAPNVCGIPSDAPVALAWHPDWPLDFDPTLDGASGRFNDDGTFSFTAPGWTGLVADLLGGWEKDAAKLTCGAVPASEPHALGPFGLAYFEALLRAADGRSSAAPTEIVTHESCDGQSSTTLVA